MQLRIALPTEVLLEAEAAKVKAEGPMGAFTLLPRHIDYATSLVPGLFSYTPKQGGAEVFLALDKGMLVKRGREVRIATARAVRGELGSLEVAVQEMLEAQTELERKSRSAVARLEADFVRRFVEF